MVNRYKRTINKSELCAQTSSPAIRTQADGYPGIPIIGRQELNEYRKKKLCRLYFYCTYLNCNLRFHTYYLGDDLKNKSDQLFKDLGTDTTSAIRMFLTQAVAYNGFLFEIKRTVHNPYTSMTEEEMLQRLEQSREYSKRGNYRNADDVISDIRGKYGL